MVKPGDDLVALIIEALTRSGEQPGSGDIIAIAQKIVSKAENRYVRLSQVQASQRALDLALDCDKDPRLVELILGESTEVVRTRKGVIIVEHKLGYVHANAGIDRSNIDSDPDDEAVLLLPENPDASARLICEGLSRHYGCKLGVLINDSAGRAWRNGTVGFTIGCAGFEPLQDLVGKEDLFMRQLEIHQVAVPDELAPAASFLMGQSDEGKPVVLIKGARLNESQQGSGILVRDKTEDLFR